MKTLYIALAVAISLLINTDKSEAICLVSYSPADSILYAQYSYGNLVLFRLQNGGSQIDRAINETQCQIMSYDNIPGHIFGYFNNGLQIGRYKSIDYGETWDTIATMPPTAGGDAEWEWCGELPGQSMLCTRPWYYTTSDSWLSYDSTRINRYAESELDSVYPLSLSYRMGLMYGRTETTQNLCVSSDSGRNWTVGSYFFNPTEVELLLGAEDEFWGRGPANQIWVVLDTGRTVIDPVFTAYPPQRPYSWHVHLRPTNNHGEAYLFADIDWWGDPYMTEFYVYHIQNYGAQVDSFYYRLENSQIQDAPNINLMPNNFTFSAFPNPFNSSVKLEWDTKPSANSSVVITDILGRRVWEWNGIGNRTQWNGMTVVGNSAATGMYWVTIQPPTVRKNSADNLDEMKF